MSDAPDPSDTRPADSHVVTEYVIPDPLRDGLALRVRPPAPRTDMPAEMVRDLLAGDVTGAGLALVDWLRGSEEPGRALQANQLIRLLRILACQAAKRAETGSTYIVDGRDREWAAGHWRGRVAGDWAKFCQEVRILFAFDLVYAGDAMRFVVEVLAPGKLEGYASEGG